MADAPADAIVPDSQHRGLVAALPQPLRNLALVARFDRPIGWWLLFWPGAWGVLLAGGEGRWDLILWLLVGAIAMRGAGCVYNDIVDADLDRQVARTAARPLASGALGKGAAWAWLVFLLRLNPLTSSDLVSYAAGLTHLPTWQLMLATLAGMAPLCFAQAYFADQNFEYPAAVDAKVAEVPASFGTFKSDTLNLSALGENQPKAQAIFNEIGFP